MHKIKSSIKYFRLTLIFAFVVFIIMFFTMFLVFSGTHFLSSLGIVEVGDFEHFPLFAFCITSIIIGTILAVLFSKAPLRPLRELIKATDRIADGDYSVRLNLRGPEEFKTLSDKFNHMTEELGSVEMLRNDFVSNFSHEIKTPIVSIRGFAKALKWDDLSSEERTEYLDIIISESERLSELSTNVLYLSKLENQSILTNKKIFNVSEQIRLVIALLDKKITEKSIDIAFDNQEYFIDGNEEMMKQVWINLIDNAIKFSPCGSKVEILIQEIPDAITIQISNEGNGLSPEVQTHLFDKFYQGDLSHSTPGNGLGLSIVKKIIDLHGGNISVLSTDKHCTFEVILQTCMF